MKIILISAKARCGKDTAAEILEVILKRENKRVLIIHYADFLKNFCKEHFGYISKEIGNGREILQHFGTDVVRKNYQDTWVDMMVALLKGIQSEYDYIIIPDVRFPNEIEKIQNVFNTVVLRIVRTNFETNLTTKEQKHESETALDNYKFEHIVLNDGTLNDFGKSLEFFAEYL
jgi:hypothetical protein